MAEKTIEIKDLVVEYRTRSGVVQALNGLSLSIEKGKTLGLVGETGAGKTTAGLAVLGLIPSPPGVIVSRGTAGNGRNSQRTGKGISSSVFWRNETESCNRHCSFLYTGTSDRGRAYYGSGCDDPGPGSGDDEGVKGKI